MEITARPLHELMKLIQIIFPSSLESLVLKEAHRQIIHDNNDNDDNDNDKDKMNHSNSDENHQGKMNSTQKHQKQSKEKSNKKLREIIEYLRSSSVDYNLQSSMC